MGTLGTSSVRSLSGKEIEVAALRTDDHTARTCSYFQPKKQGDIQVLQTAVLYRSEHPVAGHAEGRPNHRLSRSDRGGRLPFEGRTASFASGARGFPLRARTVPRLLSEQNPKRFLLVPKRGCVSSRDRGRLLILLATHSLWKREAMKHMEWLESEKVPHQAPFEGLRNQLKK